MTIYYVGKGGSNSNDGQSWANRKLTLAGAEDIPLSADDTVYVGPGSYHEMLTIDVSGSDGSPITYVADPIGIYTDQVGGLVRLTGINASTPDSSARAFCIDFGATKRDYRTFRGFFFDGAQTAAVDLCGNGFEGIVFEDCVFKASPVYSGNNSMGIRLWDVGAGVAGSDFTIRRCLFDSCDGASNDGPIALGELGDPTDYSIAGSVIENCIFINIYSTAIYCVSIYGVTVINCSFVGVSGTSIMSRMQASSSDIYSYNNFYVNTVNDSPLPYDTIVESYCTWVKSGSVEEGGYTASNALKAISCPMPPTLYQGYMLDNVPIWHQHSPWSQIVEGYGSEGGSPPSVDFYGTDRPSVDVKKTRGAVQYHSVEREVTTVPAGESESMKFRDFTVYHIPIAITGRKMTFSVQVYREADYAGTNPQMIIKQPGQSNQTVTDTGSSEQWNTLSLTFTPSNFPTYVMMELRSNNTAVAGDYATYLGKIQVR